MKPGRRLAFGVMAVALVAGRAQAQIRWSYDHVHQAAPDPQQALTWYIEHLGGQPCDGEGRVVPMDKAERALFDGITFMFLKSADVRPSSGSVIDRVAFSFPDVATKAKELEAAGAKITSPVREIPGLGKRAVVDDPSGTKIELVQDPSMSGFHHITLRVPDPEESLTWYIKTFGGERGKMSGQVDGVRYGRIWLLAERAEGTVPSQGHAIDHLGFQTANLDTAAAQAKAQGVKFTMEPRVNPANGHHIAYVEGPAGVRIELVQH
jgi:predicted enzyme related to lactoylglutathione lyase